MTQVTPNSITADRIIDIYETNKTMNEVCKTNRINADN